MTLLAIFLLVAGSGTVSAGPTTAEFAKALSEHTGRHINPADLRRLSCKDFGDDEPTEAECRWKWRVGDKWKRYSTYVAVDSKGWHLIDEPNSDS